MKPRPVFFLTTILVLLACPWLARSQNNPNVLFSVSVQNAPAVADTGTHCIICGLLTGNIHAIEPNVMICVKQGNSDTARRACTPVCMHTHDCTQSFASPVVLDPKGPALNVTIFDINPPNPQAQTAAFPLPNATQCESGQRCSIDTPGGTLMISFNTTSACPKPIAIGAPGGRICCALGYAWGIDLNNLSGHQYGNKSKSDSIIGLAGIGEAAGYVYTTKGGLMDLGHIRDNADMTLFVYEQLVSGSSTVYIENDGINVQTIPCDKRQLVELAGAIAYVSSWAHELTTWGKSSNAEDFSSFSPEDLPSNIVGVELATRAIEAGGDASVDSFNTKMDAAMRGLMAELGAQESDVTDSFLHRVEFNWGDTSIAGKWWLWDATSPGNFATQLLRRNFDGTPWTVQPPLAPLWLSPRRFNNAYPQFVYFIKGPVDARQIPETTKYAEQGVATHSLAWDPIPANTITSAGGLLDAPGTVVVSNGQKVTTGLFADVVTAGAGGPHIVASVQGVTDAIRAAFTNVNSGMDKPY